MRPLICGLLSGFFVLVVSTGTVRAMTCFVVYDRNDNISYRGTRSPIDLSDRGTAERDAMRGRGEHLLILEWARCPPIEFFTGSGGSIEVRVDEIVEGMPVPRTGGDAPVSAPAAQGARGPASASRAGSAPPAAKPAPRAY